MPTHSFTPGRTHTEGLHPSAGLTATLPFTWIYQYYRSGLGGKKPGLPAGSRPPPHLGPGTAGSRAPGGSKFPSRDTAAGAGSQTAPRARGERSRLPADFGLEVKLDSGFACDQWAERRALLHPGELGSRGTVARDEAPHTHAPCTPQGPDGEAAPCHAASAP